MMMDLQVDIDNFISNFVTPRHQNRVVLDRGRPESLERSGTMLAARLKTGNRWLAAV